MMFEYDRRGAGGRSQIGGEVIARTIRKSGVKEVPLSQIKDDLSRYLHEAETREIVITRHGKPAGVLIGLESRETGSNIGSNMTHAFYGALSRRAAVCAQDVGSGWRTLKQNSRQGHAPLVAQYIKRLIVLLACYKQR